MRTRSVRAWMAVASVALFANTGLAQNQSAGELEEVVVTGVRDSLQIVDLYTLLASGLSEAYRPGRRD
ncbi:hypothetical protein ACFPN2_22370 [Steroidobacter flavus]|uniref:Uncharacterized protein n=1 Tax=Steroidobacter flavus TaxID=1842136 RepID=A0ABV8SWC3_9GAMM